MQLRSLNKIFDAWLAQGGSSKGPSFRERSRSIGVSPPELLMALTAYELAHPIDLTGAPECRALLGELALAGRLSITAESDTAALCFSGAITSASPVNASDETVTATIGLDGGAQDGGELAITAGRLKAAHVVTMRARGPWRYGAVVLDGGDTLLSISAADAQGARYIDRLGELLAHEQGHDAGRQDPESEPGRGWAEELERRWMATRERSEVDALLREISGSRGAAYRALNAVLAEETDAQAVQRALNGAHQTKTECSLRVSDAAASLTYFGSIDAASDDDGVTRAAGGSMKFHLKDADVAKAWIVRAPTSAGLLTWIDALDADGRSICKMFGRRPDGTSLCVQGPGCWRAIIAEFVRRG